MAYSNRRYRMPEWCRVGAAVGRLIRSIVEAPNEKALFQEHLPFMDIVECDWAPAMIGEDVYWRHRGR